MEAVFRRLSYIRETGPSERREGGNFLLLRFWETQVGSHFVLCTTHRYKVGEARTSQEQEEFCKFWKKYKAFFRWFEGNTLFRPWKRAKHSLHFHPRSPAFRRYFMIRRPITRKWQRRRRRGEKEEEEKEEERRQSGGEMATCSSFP